jgi:hypothetical protein
MKSSAESEQTESSCLRLFRSEELIPQDVTHITQLKVTFLVWHARMRLQNKAFRFFYERPPKHKVECSNHSGRATSFPFTISHLRY